MNENKEWDNLLEIRDIIQRPVFQELIVQPMKDYQEKLAKAYDCDDLMELYSLKGKKEGSEQFFNTLKRISTDFKNKKDELE